MRLLFYGERGSMGVLASVFYLAITDRESQSGSAIKSAKYYDFCRKILIFAFK